MKHIRTPGPRSAIVLGLLFLSAGCVGPGGGGVVYGGGTWFDDGVWVEGGGRGWYGGNRGAAYVHPGGGDRGKGGGHNDGGHASAPSGGHVGAPSGGGHASGGSGDRK